MTHYNRGHQTQAHLMEDVLPGSGRRDLKPTATVHIGCRDDLYQDEPSDPTPSYFKALREQIIHALFPDNAFTRKLRAFGENKWRRMLVIWCSIVWLSAFIHLSQLVQLPKGDFGIGILYESSDLSDVSNRRLKWLLFLNTIATLMLTSSNYSMQCLGSPTRDDLDKWHRKGKSMAIGRYSLRNLLRIPWPRKILWVLLAVSGLPLNVLYNGLLFVSEPMRQTYEVVASNQFFAPGSKFSLLDLPLNMELSESWNSGQLPPPNPPASEDYRIPPLQKAILDVRNGNSSRWSYEQNLDCMFNLSESTVSNRPNIVLFIDWMDLASNNTVLLVGNLGYYGIEIFLPCPKSWYATIPYGLDVWNASFAVSPYFYYWAPGYGAAVNPYLTFGDNQTCPSSYSPIPQFKPPPNQLPNVTHCLTEIVEPSLYRLCYSTYILKLLTGFLFVKAFALTTSLFMLQEPPLLVLGDVLTDFLRRPDQNTSNLSFIRGKKWASHVTGPVKAHYDTRYHGCAPRFKAFFQVEDEAEPCWYLLLLATMISLTQIGNKVTSQSALGILITPDSPSSERWLLNPTFLVNCPQLFMAFRAYFDEMILTKSQTNLEFGSFSSKPRSLRLTHKSDRGQKSTYFLQIPLLLAIFYYTVVTLYNWMVASVLFSKVLNITYLGDPNTMLDPIYAIGSPEVVTSATGFVAAMSILLPYIVVFVVPFVMQIKLHQRTLALRPLRGENMPYPGCDSMVVSAACHTRPDEGDISDQRIQWGVVEQARGPREDAAGRCGFCVRTVHVNQPREGYFYTGISGIRESP